MKILYGVQGTGNGHITRARHMLKSLSKTKDLRVDFMFSGRERSAYFDMEDFAPYNSFRGLSFVTRNGQIQYVNSLLKNNIFQFAKDVSEINIKHYDLLINDFEPVSAWAAKKAGVPSLSISHQAAFLQQVPKKDQGIIDKLVTKYFAPSTYQLGTHWYHFGHNIIPPIVASDNSKNNTKKSRHPIHLQPILVYLPFEELSDIQGLLHVLSDVEFICYHPSIQANRKDHNIHWRALSRDTFRLDLESCAGVISNCGFELSTECLTLGKPLLVKPLKRQYEQISNAYTLKTLGLCEVLSSLNVEDIDDWLHKKQGVKVNFPNNCDALVEWISEGNWHASEKLCQTLWQQVKFPKTVQSRLHSFHNLTS